ncbi:alanine--tRNA ligase [Rhodopseudomonas palustris]|uniref:Alanine--tRNA ligase n=2 Tax=Rhodopseudomonas palustris (strain ATCC BAA-98 / CGA009) TaxID=258594 RepID=SYA_RHOPA|nr:alanine--tRNA ligase [Rhodopseudomonas palustris]P61706.1 RecName: Full=Alanine--tRNA ligase; AltName: Full=Alanyl-tRNA synthetase; Short=AlaRS [Rhodopseudomonas palustris CGA009]OPF92731.1 alanine--tRNA ligase [Rhodopseudomonas palustris]PPQ41151.1 alanine--tRNA ligase [Rhodopseudomonas palustris]QQM05401.1 Alanine--tRNA ligase [Rhodopseudomonas palustris]RJF63171.1 alanine--tRNA ligase [Rhodopseudomonas palustris]WAB76740.1 alanine--tRNA ligase [Rhodopseudomonas palustris]
MSGVNEIRSTFLNYFAKNGHEIVSSSPLVPRNDPTLMFTNAGMVQFKNVFTGLEKRSYQRATTSQKCVRAGGKHNDLDNVGYTARHLTFFEMLGNFSFGDYFKERAIELAWNLITRDFGLKKDKLLVTVYHTDDEAAGYWKKIAGFSDDRIIRIPTSDNFWAMGDTGPCGPCSEIFIDRGEHIFGGPPGSPDEDGDRFLEFWNLVFMQYDQVTKDERVPLPRPSIDTGMGLERMASILQGVDSVFDTDLFRSLIDATSSALGRGPTEQDAASFRVIADHLRSSSFLIADGVLPSNEGRGYVLRRIMRRAMRHAQLLGASEPLMWRLVWALVREMGQAYPELVRAEAMIEETMRLEETRFRKTLDRGLAILDEKSAGLKKGDMFDGETAFTLYDTYGFPLDLTQDALRNRGINVDIASFTDAMDRQRAKARASWAGSGEAATEAVWFSLREKLGATEFLGYDTETAEGVVTALVKDGAEVDALKAGESGAIIVNQTPFYAESGGQVGDTGVLTADGVRFVVTDTMKKAGDLFVHFGTVEQGSIKLGDALALDVDHARRSAIRANHSATHLLHEALRQVLGDHIAQKGSLVAPDRLRFDFVHQKPITQDELRKVEDIANDIVLENDEVVTRLMAVDDAREAGARALFGEKYGDEVRVVSMGKAARDHGSNVFGWSVELCGGTHVKRTGDIGLVSITGESAVAAGVRRIEALTGRAARHNANAAISTAKLAASELRTTLDDMPARITALMDERKKLERELSEARKKLAMGGSAAGDGAASDVRDIGGIKLMARAVEGIEIKDLKGLVDQGKKQLGSGVIALVATSEDGKGSIVVGVTPDLVSRFSAVDLVRKASEVLGGKGGGGKPDMAQAGGPDGSKAGAALEAIAAAIGG